MTYKKAFLINTIISLAIAATAGLLDLSLALGKFHGLVFALYTAYGLALQAIINIIIAVIAWTKTKKLFAKTVLASGLLIPAASFLLLWIVTTMAA